MEAAPGRVIGGRYQLERELARGGMGAVWLAKHLQLETAVAVKFMDPELTQSPDARARFEREAKAAATLRSPHVVQILDYGIDAGIPFIVMELLEGEDLRRRLKRRRRLPPAEAADIVRQACKALQLAANSGIVHRDLKPANIFLARSGEDEIVKVLDFGVAKTATPHLVGPGTSSGMLVGSPHYMSPEQARGGKSLDHRSDLWSLAVILYQMLTGHKPFAGTELGDVIVKICTEDLPPVSAVDPSLSPLDGFFKRALWRDADGRFQSARAFARELDRVVSTGVPSSPSRASGSFDSLAAPALADVATPVSLREPFTPASLREARALRSDTPAAGARTLQTAIDRTTQPASSRWRVVAIGVLLLAGGASALIAWSGRRPASQPGTVAPASAPEPEPQDEVAPASPTEPAEETVEETAEEPAPAVTAAAGVPASASAAASAPKPPPVRAAPPRPAPPAPPPNRDPVLGF